MKNVRMNSPFLSGSKKDPLPIGGPDFVELLQTVLDKNLPFRFQARGSSMSPFIKDGDIVTLSPMAGVPPRLGDVVAFMQPLTKRLVIHRVVGKKKHALIIMGDLSREPDGLIPQKNILGRVVKVERDDKTVTFGRGPEKTLIAALTRTGLFLRLMIPAWRIIRPLVRKSAT